MPLSAMVAPQASHAALSDSSPMRTKSTHCVPSASSTLAARIAAMPAMARLKRTDRRRRIAVMVRRLTVRRSVPGRPARAEPARQPEGGAALDRLIGHRHGRDRQAALLRSDPIGDPYISLIVHPRLSTDTT